MADKKVMLTQEGYDKLVKELDYLKSVKRLEVANRLKEAIAQGDLSENAEYDEAKEAQAFLEGKILDYEAKIANSTIIKAISGDTIGIGSKVEIREMEEVKNEAYGMVNKIYNLTEEGLETTNEIVEAEEIYKIVDSDFKEVDGERVYKIVNVNIEEINDALNEDSNSMYRLIDGGLVKFDKQSDSTAGQIYKISEVETNDVYGKIDKLYRVYRVIDSSEKFMIVGTTETNPDDGKISDECPLGSALVGNKVGGIAEVHAPVGVLYYEILKTEM